MTFQTSPNSGKNTFKRRKKKKQFLFFLFFLSLSFFWAFSVVVDFRSSLGHSPFPHPVALSSLILDKIIWQSITSLLLFSDGGYESLFVLRFCVQYPPRHFIEKQAQSYSMTILGFQDVAISVHATHRVFFICSWTLTNSRSRESPFSLITCLKHEVTVSRPRIGRGSGGSVVQRERQTIISLTRTPKVSRGFFAQSTRSSLCNLDLSLCNLDLALCNLDLSLCNLDLSLCNLDLSLCKLDLSSFFLGHSSVCAPALLCSLLYSYIWWSLYTCPC